jgi:hydrogenase expression/formation protein HypC
MCLGIPGQIIELVDAEQDLAKVDVSGVRRTISVKLVSGEGLVPGDWVLVHVGFALAKVDEAEAEATLTAMRRLGRPFLDELEAFDSTSIT